MHNVKSLLYFVVVYNPSILPIFFKVTSLALGQSWDCPSASETTLKDMGKIMWIPYEIMILPQQKMCAFYGIFCNVLQAKLSSHCIWH